MAWQDWIFGLLGGVMIGSAGAIYLLGNGRIMGASGILGGLIDGSGRADAAERAAFLAGVIGVPAVLALWLAPQTHLTDNLWLIGAGGLLTGLGTRLGNGCTSGHGVCGISRLAPRGILATLVYMLAGALTVALLRHVWGVI